MQYSEEDLKNRAVELLLQGYNCSQATLTICQELLDMRHDEVLKSAMGFGGGVGNQGDSCGAVCGGVMAISQKFGMAAPSPDKAELKELTYALTAEYVNKFRDVQGSAYCRDILGVDISDPEFRKTFWTDDKRRKCAEGPVMAGVLILCDMFKREGVLIP